jgi:hypothetical protein
MEYNPGTHEVLLSLADTFTINFDMGKNDSTGRDNFWKLFNIKPELFESMKNNWYSKTSFKNIWDRRALYVHCSIANTAPCN